MSRKTDPLQLILKAASFAAHKHKDQRRKDAAASPYINHPLTLASILREEGKVEDATVIAAALLHDTIEDTETDYDELRGQFGVEIAEMVAEVTDIKWLKKASCKRSADQQGGTGQSWSQTGEAGRQDFQSARHYRQPAERLVIGAQARVL